MRALAAERKLLPDHFAPAQVKQRRDTRVRSEGDPMMIGLMSTIAVLLVWSSTALAFDNIEADAAYDREIKQQIMSEFSQGLKMLKAQADGLGMDVREKDVKELQQWMYEKAILMGRCVDRATTLKKTASSIDPSLP
jgi:hypothetical protein